MFLEKKIVEHVLGAFNTKSGKEDKQYLETSLEVSGDTKQCAMSGKVGVRYSFPGDWREGGREGEIKTLIKVS